MIGKAWKNAIQRPGKSSCVLASRLAEGFSSVRDRNKVHICYPLSEAHVHWQHNSENLFVLAFHSVCQVLQRTSESRQFSGLLISLIRVNKCNQMFNQIAWNALTKKKYWGITRLKNSWNLVLSRRIKFRLQ